MGILNFFASTDPEVVVLPWVPVDMIATPVGVWSWDGVEWYRWVDGQKDGEQDGPS